MKIGDRVLLKPGVSSWWDLDHLYVVEDFFECDLKDYCTGENKQYCDKMIVTINQRRLCSHNIIPIGDSR